MADATLWGFSFVNKAPCQSFYNPCVSRRFHIFFSIAAILLIVGSQLCQLCDRWDTIADFGHDSEFMFFVIGLCIGMCLLLAWLAVRLIRVMLLLILRIFEAAPAACEMHFPDTGYLRLLFSPPLSSTSLRI